MENGFTPFLFQNKEKLRFFCSMEMGPRRGIEPLSGDPQSPSLPLAYLGQKKVVDRAGFEPAASAVQGRRSTTDLPAH